mmetsp:Transcript_43020/g.168374  ORF Transcript_43020/g.168374 Transcript_43020/m.168374 type:complete len:346 (-) Transcript_43020:2085-3122(-)|eukprot:CAMPEP_0113958604 /NCGR_PEP_ID=MMETSP0011_2-20120614/3554_1 /TAXON_ID=101924 /ORGANISM="Rhodosorus marinus" /LENGTH=345 /DNA_ID=CAMNT_0000969569 /DNA_START=132 /DNA_END=1169 /DNA_ORIENTATION=+ /assembly_acc=CAM_ASM_000156
MMGFVTAGVGRSARLKELSYCGRVATGTVEGPKVLDRRCSGVVRSGVDNVEGEQRLASTPQSEDELGYVRKAVFGVIVSLLFLLWPLMNSVTFAAVLTALCVLGQHYYYRTAESQSYLPARRTGLITTMLMMFTIMYAPAYSTAVIPICSTLICCYLLFREKPRIATIADLSTTLTGLFYAALLPSFYVRLHMLDYMSSSRLRLWFHAHGVHSFLGLVPTSGALTIFMTFVVGGASDLIHRLTTFLLPEFKQKNAVGYAIWMICNMALNMATAYFLSWRNWRIYGVMYGTVFSLCGLIGRLAAPMFERAEEDGEDIVSYRNIFKRTDSYMFLAPLAYYFVVLTQS